MKTKTKPIILIVTSLFILFIFAYPEIIYLSEKYGNDTVHVSDFVLNIPGVLRIGEPTIHYVFLSVLVISTCTLIRGIVLILKRAKKTNPSPNSEMTLPVASQFRLDQTLAEKTKILKNRWFLLILGLLLGAYIGGDLALRYASSKNIEYDQALEDHYIDSRIWSVFTSTRTLVNAEEENLDKITNSHKMYLRAAFLTLLELHKTGHYERKSESIKKELKRAKEFMSERPDQFLDQEYFSVSPSLLIDQINNPEKVDDAEDIKVTNHARKELQEAFDYVDGLATPSNTTNSEQGGREERR